MDLHYTDAYMDSRAIQERLIELEAMLYELDGEWSGEYAPEEEEYEIYMSMKQDAEHCGWDDGIYFIRDDKFTDHAMELAVDCGMISDDEKWPCTCIDWDAAAQELRHDYTCVDVAGVDYYYREA